MSANTVSGRCLDTVQLELRAAEGGLDAKLFVDDLLNMYRKFCNRMGFVFKEVLRHPGEVHAQITGKDAYS